MVASFCQKKKEIVAFDNPYRSLSLCNSIKTLSKNTQHEPIVAVVNFLNKPIIKSYKQYIWSLRELKISKTAKLCNNHELLKALDMSNYFSTKARPGNMFISFRPKYSSSIQEEKLKISCFLHVVLIHKSKKQTYVVIQIFNGGLVNYSQPFKSNGIN